MSLIDTDVPQLVYRRTRIVATLGPTSSDLLTIAGLIDAGVNVFRFNMSHGTHEQHAARYALVRQAAAEAGATVAVLADLCGPKIRVGTFINGSIALPPGEPVVVTARDVQGTDGLIPTLYPALANDVAEGDRILMDDGKLELRVEHVQGTEIHCLVVHGGRLSNRKGINLPGVAVSAPALTDKDKVDAAFALDLGADLLSLSFVRHADDVHQLRHLCAEHGRVVPIVSKIVKPEALTHAQAILDASDVIMIARGDLGVELPPEQVPLAQEQLIHAARVMHKPVIVATQMLESMIHSARPTRAEVSDVAGAVRSGADAIMLSGESAIGDHPILAVQTMDRICRQTEGFLWQHGGFSAYRDTADAALNAAAESVVADAVAESVAQLSRTLKARAIVVFTHSGQTAATICASRPAAPIVTATTDAATARTMVLLWGAIPAVASEQDATDPRRLVRLALDRPELQLDESVAILVSGIHRDSDRNMPSVTVLRP